MEINKIYNEDNLVTCRRMPDGFVDLVVTSPPYDNLRTYNGFSWDFEALARGLYRVVKVGGAVVWVVGDSTVNGSESGTSFQQALYFKEVGFNLHDTMIYEKANFSNPSTTRYHQIFEYMFVFSKGTPTFNPILDVKNIYGVCFGQNTSRQKNGEMKASKKNEAREWGMRKNIWRINTVGQDNVCQPQQHPAAFSEDLACDHIKSWSNEGELVYDPFMGSGTTAVAAHKLGRRWIGSEISAEYTEMANKRLEPYLAQESLF